MNWLLLLLTAVSLDPRFQDQIEDIAQLSPQAAEAVDQLIDRVKHAEYDDLDLLLDAVMKLQASKAAVPLLVQALNDNGRDVRVCAALVLGRIGPETSEAVPLLIEASQDDHAAVRGHAAEALGRIGQAAKPAVPALLNALKKQRDKFPNWEIGKAIGGIGRAAVPDLVPLLQDHDAVVRRAALWCLAQTNPDPSEVVPVVAGLLKDADPAVRSAAGDALWRIGGDAKAVVPPLAAALTDTTLSVRKDAAMGLAQIGPAAKSAIPGLVDALKDPDKEVRLWAAMALGGIGPQARAAAPALVERLDDPDSSVRLVSVRALGSIRADAELAAPALIRQFTEGDRHLRIEAAECLWKLDPDSREAFQELVACLSNNLSSTYAAGAIGRIGPNAKAAVPALIDALKATYEIKLPPKPDRDSELARLNTNLLNGRRRPFARLRAQAEVRESIIRALGRIGREAREAVPLLVQAITDRDATVRIETAQAIWRIDRDTDAAMKVLTELLNETTLPSILTASALGHEPGTPSDPTVLHHQLYNGLRRQVVQTLGEIGPDAKAAIPLLIKSIRDRDEYVSIYSADALGAIGSSASAAVPLLAEALTDPDRRVREAARKALQKIDPAAAESVLRPIE